MMGPDVSAARPSRNDAACQRSPNRPSLRNASELSMAAAGSPIAPGMLKAEWSSLVVVTSTHPASHGKNPTVIIPRPAAPSRAIARDFHGLARSPR